MEKIESINENFELTQELKDSFIQEISLYSVKIKKELTDKFVSNFKQYLYRFKNFNPVINVKDENANYIILNFKSENINEINNLEQILMEKKIEIISHQPHTVKLGYDNFNANEILKKLLPEKLREDKDLPSSYETVGTIAHMTLREQFLPYKKLIGAIFLDKNNSLKTVINKTGKIDNVFRTYEMELLAGVDNTEVALKEGKCIFHFDLKKVYWCSKLSSERDRLVEKIKGKTLCDAFCGVGPLAVRVAKEGSHVYASDLNSYCYQYLVKNVAANKLTKNVECYNLDAREFIRKMVHNTSNTELNLDEYSKKKKIDVFYMNLPKDALEFLDVFIGLFNNCDSVYKKGELPMVNVYCFAKEHGGIDEIIDRIREAMRYSNFSKDDISDIHNIKDISNKKYMYCVSFKIPDQVGFTEN